MGDPLNPVPSTGRYNTIFFRCFRDGVKYINMYIDNMKIQRLSDTGLNNGCQEHHFRGRKVVHSGEAGVARLLHHSEQQP